jgi:signal transduction histidine kinase
MLDSLDYKSLGNMLAYNYDISACFAHQNNYKKAFTFLDKAFTLQDSLNNNKQNELTLELETKYQTQKKEHEIALLKTESELVRQQKINQRNLFITGIVTTSFAGLFFFILYRNRKRTTKKLQELDRAKSNFFTNISHEFRTPLTLISGPIQQQLKKKNISQNDRSSLEMIQRNSDRLLSLVDQLLDISKIEAGRLQLKVSKHEIKPFLGTLIDGFEYTAKQKQIEYTINTNLASDIAWFDKNVLEKIVINLLSNAFKYTPNNGEIVCNACIKDDYLHFEVKNTGAGLSQEELTKIFERFYQLNENEQGTGVGLALVKELVNLHHGNITVDSTLNEWTTFKIILPINKSFFKESDFVDENFKEQQISLNTPINYESDKYQEVQDAEIPILLLVDDNVDVRNYVSNLFKETYVILHAKNGQEGIELAIEHIPDIIISDIMMPIKNGIELCDTLKSDERTSHIPIILLTAKAGTENEIEGIKTGADDYITKPFHED